MSGMEFIAIGMLGLLAGFTAGLFGLGGGCVMIPLFLFLLPKMGTSPLVVMHQAVATSLAVIIFNSLSASLKQYKLENIDFVVLKAWIPFVVLGTLGALFVFKQIPSIVLQVAFMIYLVFCAIYMYFKETDRPVSLIAEEKIPGYSLSLAGVLVGMLASLLGIGGGTFTVPYFTHHRFALKKAIAISSVTGLFVGSVGALAAMYSGYGVVGLANYSIGFVNILLWIIMTPCSMIAATYGVKVNHRLQSKPLKIMYITFLFIIVGLVYVQMP